MIVVDALVTSIEPLKNSIVSILDIRLAIEDSSKQKPWLKDLIKRCKEIGITRKELYQITLTIL